MKAAVGTRYGPPGDVRLEEVDTPEPDDNELLLKVYATTVNRTDCGFRAAKPFILRLRGQTFEVGDRVFGYSEGQFGAHADHMTIPEDGPVATSAGCRIPRASAASSDGVPGSVG